MVYNKITKRKLAQWFLTGGNFPYCGKFCPCTGKSSLVWCSGNCFKFYSNI